MGNARALYLLFRESERKKHMKQQEDVAKCERIVFQF